MMKATHFQSLNSSLNSKKILVAPELFKEQGTTIAAIEMCQRISDQAICFNLGEFFRDPENIKGDPEKIRLPFDVCWFETSVGAGDLLGAICTEIIDDGGGKEYVGQIFFSVFYFQAAHKTWHLLRQGIWDRDSIVTCSVPSGEGSSRRNAGNAVGMLGVVGRALTALACDNIDPIEHKPSALRKKIAKSRNLPAFSTWTLEIRPRKNKGASLGGTHKSPRFHLRRGTSGNISQDTTHGSSRVPLGTMKEDRSIRIILYRSNDQAKPPARDGLSELRRRFPRVGA